MYEERGEGRGGGRRGKGLWMRRDGRGEKREGDDE